MAVYLGAKPVGTPDRAAFAFRPWAFNKLTSFIKSQIDSAMGRQVAVHYHRIDAHGLVEDSPPVDSERANGLQFSTYAARAQRSWL